MPRGMVAIKADRCKSCGLCTHVCPSGCLALATEGLTARGYRPVRVIAPEDCIGCGSCALVCPDVVINVYRERKQSRPAAVSAPHLQREAPVGQEAAP